MATLKYSRAFLSHSSNDKNLVGKIAKAMGDKCVYDSMTFEPGMPILSEILDGMSQSEVFVLFISESALSSDWVKKEITNAKEMSADNIKRILPIIIDKTIKHDDERIPDWLRGSYSIQYIDNENIILNKIYTRLRYFKFIENSANQKETFIGRSKLFDNFNTALISSIDRVPTYIIAYNYLTGIGRRAFMKEALRRLQLLERYQEPIVVSLNKSESLESFIYSLNSIKKVPDIWELDLSKKTLEEKIEIAKSLVQKFVDACELIFIEDDGSFILPTHKIASWFQAIIDDERFKNRLVFILISHFRPDYISVRNTTNQGLSFPVDELSKEDTLTLFNLLLRNNRNSISATAEDFKVISTVLTGVPAQIYFAIELLRCDRAYALTHIKDIETFSDTFPISLINELRKYPEALQLLIFLSKEDIISLDVIEQVFGKTSDVNQSLSILNDYGSISMVMDNLGFIKLSPTVARYIQRAEIALDSSIQNAYEKTIKNYDQKSLDELLREDYSKFVIRLRSLIAKGQAIPEKYFMPSLVLKSIIQEYQAGHYAYVIELCERLLANNTFDNEIEWSTRYRLSMAYARDLNKSDEFFKSLDYFKGQGNYLDYNFMLGFYYRIRDRHERAIEYFDKALKINPNHQSSLREKVNSLLALERFDVAYDLAKSNYLSNRTDVMHAHAYFKTIICSEKQNNEQNDVDLLMDQICNSKDKRAPEIFRCMEGEYAFYVDHNKTRAEELLVEAIHLNNNKEYAKRALQRIYKITGDIGKANKLDSSC